jgi:hypothetical protein
LSNETSSDAIVSYYFTNIAGQDIGFASLTLPAGHQIAAFLNQTPFSAPLDNKGNFIGSFTFTSSVPLGAIALRGVTNERGEFLITTLPVSTLGAIAGPAVLPHFADGGGWTTQVVLTNNTDGPLAGAFQFFSQGSLSQPAQLLTLTINGSAGSTFSYSIPAHSSASFLTSGTSANPQVGWVQVAPSTTSGAVPTAVSIFSFQNSQGITVSDASVMAFPAGSNLLSYLEASGIPGQVGAIQTGVAIANPSATPALVTLSLYQLNGSPLGLSQAVSVPAGGQIAAFVNQLFPQLPLPFRGVAQITSTMPIYLAALRERYNERGDFMITATPPLNTDSPPSGTPVFPHIVSGMGYGTQVVIFGQAASGKLFLLDQNGNLKSASSLTPQ